MPKICPYCKSKNPESANFCQDCGKPLTASVLGIVVGDIFGSEKTAPLDVKTPVQEDEEPQISLRTPVKLSRRIIVWARFLAYASIITTLLAVTAIVFCALSPSEQNTEVSLSSGTVMSALVFYVLSTAISIQILAKIRGVGASWLAWTPVGKSYILGKLVRDIVWRQKHAIKILTYGAAGLIYIIAIPIVLSLLVYLTGSEELLRALLEGGFIKVVVITALSYICLYGVYKLSAYYKLLRMNRTRAGLAFVGALTILFIPFLLYRAAISYVSHR